MAAVNYAEQYSQALAQAYPYVLYFNELRATENSGKYKVVDAKTIKIPVISTTGRTAGNRDTIGSFSRNADNTWETKTLANHRQWQTLMHPMDVDQSNMVLSIQNVTQVMNEEKKFPEMDAYLISKLYADWIAQGKVADTTVPTVDNILTIFDSMMQAMDEARVPESGRILYNTPAMDTLFKNAKAIARSVSAQGGNGGVIERAITRLDQVALKKVPSDLMKTTYDFTVGAVPGVGAKQINMLLVHPSAVLALDSYEYAGMEEPSAHSQGKYLYFEESFEDVFILNNKKHAIAFNKEA